MKRITVHIAENQYEWLHRRSNELGITAAEILRQALEHWINVYQRQLAESLSESPSSIALWLKQHSPMYEAQKKEKEQTWERLEAAKVRQAMEAMNKKGSLSLESLDQRLRSIEQMLEKLLEKE